MADQGKVKMNSDMKIFIVFAVIIALGFLLLFYNMMKPPVIVTIDGVKVNSVEFQYYYSQNLSQALQTKDSSMDEATFLNQSTGSGTVKDSIKQQALNQVIQVEILLQKAKKEHFKFDNKELDTTWQTFKDSMSENAKSSQMTLESYTKAAIGMNLKDAEKNYRNYAKAQKYLTAKAEELAVDKNEMTKYYEENKSNIDRAVIRHILVMCESNAAADVIAEKKKLAESILEKVKNGEDFAALAKQYSEDPGSKDNGGMYEIQPNGQMVAEFQDWTFSHKAGDIGIIQTSFGFHVMKLDSIYDTLDSQIKSIEGAYKFNKYETMLAEAINAKKFKIEVKEAYTKF